MMTAKEIEATQRMRLWHMAKLTGQAPEQIREWPVDDLVWAEAIETYIQEEQAKAAARRRR